MRAHSIVIVGLTILLSFSAASARDLAIPECRCQITIPDSWSPSPMGAPAGAHLVAARDASNSQGTSLYVAALPATADGQSAYLKNMEQRISGHNYTLVSRQHQQIGNYDFYVIDGTQPARNGGTMHCSQWITFANKQVFQIDLYSQDADPVTDPAMLAVIQSFAISRPN